jgi:rRNA maturation endonuclease Nob1
MGSRRTLVLDTSAFIAGFNPSAVVCDLYSVPDVEHELTKADLIKVRFQAAVESGKLKILSPDVHYLDAVREASKEIGDMRYLSEADMHVIALAAKIVRQRLLLTITPSRTWQQKSASTSPR